MFTRQEKPIAKEQYERIQSNNGLISREDKDEIFSTAELCGYGISSPIVYKSHDETTGEDTYIVSYYTSDSCD